MQKSILIRLHQYQKERFPILRHGLLITAFTFCAISFSRLSRGMNDFVDLKTFSIGVYTSFSFFFLLRIFDEFKDQKEDSLYRKYLPVPRGLVSLKELAILGLVIGLTQYAIILLLQPKMLILFLIVWIYLLLMRYEFFMADWLKEKPIIYLVSHMMIIPLIDLYSSGLDWNLSNSGFHFAIYLFIAISFFNGIVIEFGRKIKSPKDEEEGVNSYTKIYGTKSGAVIWMVLLSITFLLSIVTMFKYEYHPAAIIIISTAYILSLAPSILFVLKPIQGYAKSIEKASGLWTLIMYLTLGGFPMLHVLIH